MKVYLKMSLPVLLFLAVDLTEFSSAFQSSPNAKGTEEVLEEVFVKSGTITLRVGSNGCTTKNDFRVEVKKEAGVSSVAPHYVLTFYRIRRDDCKAIVDEGTLIIFDLQTDIGLSGNYTFSIGNRIAHSPQMLERNGKRYLSQNYFVATIPRVFSNLSDKSKEHLKEWEFSNGNESVKIVVQFYDDTRPEDFVKNITGTSEDDSTLNGVSINGSLAKQFTVKTKQNMDAGSQPSQKKSIEIIEQYLVIPTDYNKFYLIKFHCPKEMVKEYRYRFYDFLDSFILFR